MCIRDRNTRGLKLKNVYKTLLMFPWAMPAYVSILLWKVGIYNTEFGLANKVLSALGFDKVNYLASNVPAFIFCMVLNLWMALPFMIMMFDGALQSIDKSLSLIHISSVCYPVGKSKGLPLQGHWLRNRR